MGYGSYTASEPSMTEHDSHYKDPVKIVLKDPSNDSYFSDKNYFISLESITDVKVQVSVNKKVVNQNKKQKMLVS